MATWFGKAFRFIGDVGATVVSQPLNALGVDIGQSKLYSSTKTATQMSAASKFVSQIALSAIGGGSKDGKALSTTDQISNAITSIFGGVAEKAGTAAGEAAGGKIQETTKTYSPFVIILVVLGIILLIVTIIVTLFKRRRR